MRRAVHDCEIGRDGGRSIKLDLIAVAHGVQEFLGRIGRAGSEVALQRVEICPAGSSGHNLLADGVDAGSIFSQDHEPSALVNEYFQALPFGIIQHTHARQDQRLP